MESSGAKSSECVAGLSEDIMTDRTKNTVYVRGAELCGTPGRELLTMYKNAFPKKHPSPKHPNFDVKLDQIHEQQQTRALITLHLAYHLEAKEA